MSKISEILCKNSVEGVYERAYLRIIELINIKILDSNHNLLLS